MSFIEKMASDGEALISFYKAHRKVWVVALGFVAAAYFVHWFLALLVLIATAPRVVSWVNSNEV